MIRLSRIILSRVLIIALLSNWGCVASPPEDRDWQSYIRNGQTTADMSDRAVEALEELRKRMQVVLNQIKEEADEQEERLLEANQRAWLQYAESKARYVADKYRDGSLALILYGQTLMTEMQHRIHELQDMKVERETP